MLDLSQFVIKLSTLYSENSDYKSFWSANLLSESNKISQIIKDGEFTVIQLILAYMI